MFLHDTSSCLIAIARLLATASLCVLADESSTCSAESNNCSPHDFSLEELESGLQQIAESAFENQRTQDGTEESVLHAILSSITNSSAFKDHIWLRRPVRVHLGSKVLGSAMFKMTDALALVERGLVQDGGTNGFMLEGVKTGAFKSFRFDSSKGGSLITKKEVQESTKKSTWLIGSAHTLHDGVANATLDFQRVFGVPGSTNVYVTRPNFATAAPLHTDRQDSFILQTSGAKKWTIYSPTVPMPLWGVHVDGQWAKGGGSLPEKECGPMLYDGVLTPGDMLYLPRAFPHRTSTVLDTKEKASVAMTVAVSTEAWNLVYEKVVRCALGAAGLCNSPPPVACLMGPTLTKYARTSNGSLLRAPLPVGFLAPASIKKPAWVNLVVDAVRPDLQRFLDEAMADGSLDKSWKDKQNNPAVVALERSIKKIAGVIWDALPSALTKLETSFSGRNEAVPFRDRQNHWGKLFSSSTHPLGDMKVCHPYGGRAIFSDYPKFGSQDEDEFTRKLRTLANDISERVK